PPIGAPPSASNVYRKRVIEVKADVFEGDAEGLGARLLGEAFAVTMFGLVGSLFLGSFSIGVLAPEEFGLFSKLGFVLVPLGAFALYLAAVFTGNSYGYRLPLTLLRPHRPIAHEWISWLLPRRGAWAFLKLWRGEPHERVGALIMVDRDV